MSSSLLAVSDRVQSVVFVDGNGDPLRECSQLTQQVAAFARVLVLSIRLSLSSTHNAIQLSSRLPPALLQPLQEASCGDFSKNQFFVENNRLDGMFTHTFPQLIFFLFHSKHFHLFKLCLKIPHRHVVSRKNTKERSKQGIDSDDATFDPSSFNNNGEMIIALFEHLLSEIRRLADYDVAARKAASDVYSSLISSDSFGTLKQLPSNISDLSANGMLSNMTVNWNTSMNGAMGSSRKRRTREEQSENTVTIEVKDVIDIESIPSMIVLPPFAHPILSHFTPLLYALLPPLPLLRLPSCRPHSRRRSRPRSDLPLQHVPPPTPSRHYSGVTKPSGVTNPAFIP
ncbi:hypothetical protein BLNAU_21764 [Blattamonas nauphoetae]|uniref:Uncharacterized protein n=1 Tax=Blattamonas nauphoetae TaxID=2049346 RepID=A0ABQ9WV11_9EUKA|nr:hypothetical protein BLNAU_21764 [Blattamonas nauphoetae]